MSAKVRDQEGYVRFLIYLDETGLDAELRAICRRHAVTPKDVYLNSLGPTVHAARIEIWWWLTEIVGKSSGEVGHIFDRDASTIRSTVKRLRSAAADMGVELDADRVPGVARAVAVATAAKQVDSGRLSALNRAARAIKP